MYPLRTALSVSLETFRLNPLRSALSTLGMMIGVASLVAVLSLADGMERTVREQLESTTNVQTLTVEALRTEVVDGQRFPLADTVQLTNDDLLAARRLTGVDGAMLVVRGSAEIRSSDSGRRRMSAVMGVTPGVEHFGSWELAAGRLLTESDSGNAGDVALITASLATDLTGVLRPDSVLGRRVLIGREALRIVGVLRSASGEERRRLAMPLATLVRTAPGIGGRHPSLLVHASRVEQVATIEEGLRRHLAGRGAGWKRGLEIQTYRARADQAAQGILVFKLLMGAITGISLIVGGIGIMNVLLASVTERTREIGIRKAAGARHRDILFQFLAESVAISSIGSLIGIVLGLTGSFALTAIIRHFAEAGFVRVAFTWSSVLASAMLSVLIGLAFGTYPARRAAGLSPIDAIRHE